MKTIIAEITPAGKGAVSGLRISGKETKKILEDFFDLKVKKNRHAYFIKNKIDEVVIIFYKSPNSYTGEDVAEIFCHANPLIVNELINELLKFNNVSIAEPGEFTKRAFLNGKMDLIQAESVLDLINANSKSILSYKKKVLTGYFSDKIKEIRKTLMGIAVKAELEIDFEEEGFVFDIKEAQKEIKNILKYLDDLISSFYLIEKLSKDIKVAIVGEPNVGKSSIFNKLINKERSIIDEKPGTTRDYIEEQIVSDKMNLILIDTAGIRNAITKVEKEGIKRTNEILKNVDFIIEVTDRDDYFFEHPNSLKVRNKIDLGYSKQKGVLYVSAFEDIGILELKEKLFNKINKNLDKLNNRSDFFMVTKRQESLIIKLRESLSDYENLKVDSFSFILKKSIDIIDELLGSKEKEVLDELFSNFCIGK
jgi:tRNA modification GTPase